MSETPQTPDESHQSLEHSGWFEEGLGVMVHLLAADSRTFRLKMATSASSAFKSQSFLSNSDGFYQPG